MNKYERIIKLPNDKFKRITGVTREVFEKMLEVLQASYNKSHAKGGPKGISAELKLTIALEYWREYRSMDHMALDYGIPRSTLCDSIMWVENVLSASEEFKIKDLKERFKPNDEEGAEIEVILIDVEEQPIERPKYNQKDSYSGKKNNIPPNIKS